MWWRLAVGKFLLWPVSISALSYLQNAMRHEAAVRVRFVRFSRSKSEGWDGPPEQHRRAAAARSVDHRHCSPVGSLMGRADRARERPVLANLKNPGGEHPVLLSDGNQFSADDRLSRAVPRLRRPWSSRIANKLLSEMAKVLLR